MAADVASAYRAGPGFLVGDAAHRMPPYAGLGLNTAVHDGHELGWRLAWAARGLAGDALLTSYADEREPVGRANALRSLDTERHPDDGLPRDLGGTYRSAVIVDDGAAPAVGHHRTATARRAGAARVVPRGWSTAFDARPVRGAAHRAHRPGRAVAAAGRGCRSAELGRRRRAGRGAQRDAGRCAQRGVERRASRGARQDTGRRAGRRAQRRANRRVQRRVGRRAGRRAQRDAGRDAGRCAARGAAGRTGSAGPPRAVRRAYRLGPESAVLVRPDGVVVWRHDGPADPPALASAVRTALGRAVPVAVAVAV